ncbi:MAG: VOC family protein [Thermomicrobiales bacterium]|nr:VOC family protein [Thermomicrobiales bacterium]
MAVKAVDHVMLAIPPEGESAARAFYAGLLGLREIEKPEQLRQRGGLWFQIGGVQLHLGIDSDFRPARKAHVAFRGDDLATLRHEITSAGLAITDDDLLPGFDRFYVDDPFGNRLEFLSPEPGNEASESPE